MARYIDKDALIKQFECNGGVFLYGQDGVKAIVSRIKMQPTADVVEVKHGKWDGLECNLCGHFATYANDYNYCPNCGAKMDGKEP